MSFILLLLLIMCFLPTIFSTAEPTEREDVIGQYALTNEERCNRLCWYRRLCSSYSYHSGTSDASSALSPDGITCVLHTDLGNSTTPTDTTGTSTSGWEEKSPSGSHIQHTCRLRPCGEREMCVPTSSISGSASSHTCLPEPAACGNPNPVSNGDVITDGTAQDDVGLVTCNPGYVASPRDVSVEIQCLVTSKWSAFQGICTQYEYLPAGGTYTVGDLPWDLQPNSSMCVRGNFTGDGQLFVNLRHTYHNTADIYVHLMFRHNYADNNMTGVFWNARLNGTFQQRRELADTSPLTSGLAFNLTLRVQSEQLHMTLEVTGDQVHDYHVPISDGPEGVDESDISRILMFETGGPPVRLTYVNLIEGC